MISNSDEPETYIIYTHAVKTKNEPNCVHITKYIEACIALLLGLTKYTKKNDGNNKNS